MANANDLRKGMCIRYNSNPAIVLDDRAEARRMVLGLRCGPRSRR